MYTKMSDKYKINATIAGQRANNDAVRTNAIVRHMVRQKIYGVILALCGMAPIIIEKDATIFILLSMFFLPMIFSKHIIII